MPLSEPCRSIQAPSALEKLLPKMQRPPLNSATTIRHSLTGPRLSNFDWRGRSMGTPLFGGGRAMGSTSLSNWNFVTWSIWWYCCRWYRPARNRAGRNQAIGVCRRLSSIVAAYQELSKGTKTQELSDAGIGLSEHSNQRMFLSLDGSLPLESVGILHNCSSNSRSHRCIWTHNDWCLLLNCLMIKIDERSARRSINSPSPSDWIKFARVFHPSITLSDGRSPFT